MDLSYLTSKGSIEITKGDPSTLFRNRRIDYALGTIYKNIDDYEI